jgi:hypothetical protein
MKLGLEFSYSIVALGLLSLGFSSRAFANTSLNSAQREQLISRASVWQDPGNISQKDLFQGPGTRFRTNESVTCDYAGLPHSSGMTPKFLCKLADGSVVKVKYGRDNGEVYGEVMGSRLFWALGFGTDTEYPVQVICNGCSNDPFKHGGNAGNQVSFMPAVIEEKVPGKTLETKDDEGWSFDELKDLTSERDGGASVAEQDALRLLAAFVQHGDNKAANQKIICPKGSLPEGATSLAECQKPFMYVSDLGATFGKGAQGGLILAKTKATLDAWADEPLWKNERKCKTNLDMINVIFFQRGTLSDPVISEAGRQMLADLLSQLSDQQLADMFRASRVEMRGEIVRADGHDRPATVSDWVRVFRRKQAELTNVRCPR